MHIVNAPTVSEVFDYYHPPPAQTIATADSQKEIVAVATACFNGIATRPFDSHRLLTAQMAVDYGSNLWLVFTHERMPYPDSILFAIGSMLASEKKLGRKADWFLWIDDDVSIPPDTMRRLRAAADPEKRPFVACVGYDRIPPFPPAVWDKMPDGTVKQWDRVPPTGVYEVFGTGLVAGLFHRSLFDRVPEPWFATTSGRLKYKTNARRASDMHVDVDKGLKPDTYWCNQLAKAGIKTYVECGIEVTHFGMPIPVNHRTAPVLRELACMGKTYVERETRGSNLEGRNRGPLHASVGQDTSQGMDGSYEISDELRPIVRGGPNSGVPGKQVVSTARPELHDKLGSGEQAALPRDWKTIKSQE